MAIVVAEGVVEVTADGTAVPREVARDIQANAGASVVTASGMSLGRSIFGGIMAGWAAIGGVTAITSFFRDSITGASDLVETQAAVEQVFGSSAAAVLTFGRQANDTLGQTQQQALEGARTFGILGSAGGLAGNDLASFSTNLVGLATDMASFNNTSVDEAILAIGAGLRGEAEPLRRFGILLDDATLRQEAMRLGIYDGNGALTTQQRVLAANAAIMAQAGVQQGDFARTADGAANSQRIVTARFEEQRTMLGQQLLPVWTSFLGWVGGTALPMFRDLVTWIGNNSDTLLILAGVIGGTVIAYQAAATATALYRGFQVASAAATGGLTVAQWALNAAMSANPIGIIIVAIGALVAAIVWIATQTTWFQDIWSAVTTALGAAWTWLWETVLKPVFDGIAAVFTWLWDNIIYPIVVGIMLYIGLWAAIFTWLWETVLSPIFGFIGAVFGWLWDTIISPIINYIVLGVQVWGAIFDWLWNNAISPALSAIGAGFQWVYDNVIAPVAGFIGSAIRTVGDTVSSVFGGIAGFIGSAFQSVLSVVRAPLNAIIGLVNGAIGGLNSLRVTIPDWVPIVGGQTWGLNLPKIPMLARGAMSAPDVFIAGEAGPELIVGGAGSRVYSNSETRDLLAGRGGDSITIGSIVIPADTIDDFVRIIEMLKALRQVARTGKGATA